MNDFEIENYMLKLALGVIERKGTDIEIEVEKDGNKLKLKFEIVSFKKCA